MGDELWRKGALELAALISGGEVTSREVVAAHLARIDEVNPHLNAVVRVLADEALDAADRADRAARDGTATGPLHGVPCTVKENIDVAGTPTTSGVPAFAEAIASIDAPHVERLRAAGAIPIGRTNLPDFGLRVHTDSALHGLTRNPWDPERTAGGSSGGEASAIASGMSPLGLGNDLGGSLRNPAHCCGIASIKPSTGVVPYATVVPPDDLTLSFQLMAVEGVMARRVRDVRAGLLAIAGRHARDPLSVDATLLDLAPGERLRVAVLAEPPGGFTDPGIAAVVRAAADVLADAGHDVVETVPPHYERVVEMWGRVLQADIAVQQPLLELVMGDGGRRFLEHGLRYLPPSDLAGWATELTTRFGMGRAWSEWHETYHVLVSPVWTAPAFPHGFDIETFDQAVETLQLIRPVLPMNVLGLPSAVVPAGTTGGLPVGVQISGWRQTDLRCLTIAEQIDDVLGLATPIDPIVR